MRGRIYGVMIRRTMSTSTCSGILLHGWPTPPSATDGVDRECWSFPHTEWVSTVRAELVMGSSDDNCHIGSLAVHGLTILGR